MAGRAGGGDRREASQSRSEYSRSGGRRRQRLRDAAALPEPSSPGCR